MLCGCGISSPLEVGSYSEEMTMLQQITFFSTLAGFGFLLGVISGSILGAGVLQNHSMILSP
jgi:hypothetical protein